MGQAAVIDLPDSPEKASASVTNADDLLAQLAGAEIDRLLADTDRSAPTTLPTTEPMPEIAAQLEQRLNPPAPSDGTSTPSNTDQAQSGTGNGKAVAAAPSAPPVAKGKPEAKSAGATDAQFAAEVDALFKELNVDPATMDAEAAEAVAANVAAAAPTAPVSSALETPPTALEASDPTPSDTSSETTDQPADQATSAVEKAALAVEAEIAADSASSATPKTIGNALVEVKQQQQHESSSDRVPVYVRLLEMVNAPLNAFPDSMRDLVGKLAILTLMNSLGVLLYILLFRPS